LTTYDEKQVFLGGRVVVMTGDLRLQNTDAIVNAANWTLMGGGGVDGAIHRVGGPRILEECSEIRRTQFPNGLPTGEAVITTAGDLLARHVIHTVGPIYGRHEGREGKLLGRCYGNCLALAVEQGLSSIAFPSISTGAFGYPRAEAAAISSKAVADFLATDDHLREVRLVFFSRGDQKQFLSNHNLDQSR
jgi:O-acetyl-ADP-ribose deacetylase